MKYKELREYIISKMRSDKAHGEENYQAVVIRFLNQTQEGVGKKTEIIVELQKENLGNTSINSDTLQTVTDTLTRNEIVSEKKEDIILLDFKSYTVGEKAEITKRCNDRIRESTKEKVPYYLLFRHKSENNLYEDDPSGKIYHFPHNPNYKKVVEKAKAVWYDKIDGTYYFWGYGTVSKVNTRPDGNFEANFEDYTLFEKEEESIEKHEKYLKKATPKIEKMIKNRPGYNVQHSILEINKEIFDEITDGKNNNIDSMEIAHKLFLIEMEQKKSKIPFIDFEHIDFVKDEINYKITALEKSLSELSLDKWDEWVSTPEKICQAVRNAVAQKISKNLIWTPPHNTEIEYFDELEDSVKKEFGINLFDFFKGNESINIRFDKFIVFLEQKKIYVEMRFLAYLLFLLDSKKYFPIHPTNFNNLLTFHKILIHKEKSWKKYSQYVELVEALKMKLGKKYAIENLTILQVQSYMWIIAGAISKNYFMIRAGRDGEDWENQRSRGVIGIHYYTFDLNETINQNNQLSKNKVKNKIHEIREKNSEKTLSDAEFSSVYGQLQSIHTIKLKDKVIAISNNSILLGVGNVTGKYQFRPEISNNCHTANVDWYNTTAREIPQQSIRRTITNLTVKEYVDLMSSQETTQNLANSEFSKILLKKQQLIFYGPPGTGKTYTAAKLAKEIIQNNSSKSTLTFRAAAIKILKDEGQSLHYGEITKRALEQNLIQTKGKTPKSTLVTVISDDIQQKGNSSIFKKISKGIYSLNPDVELIEELKEGGEEPHQFIRNVTFHQSYSYEEFIEGIKPSSDDGKVIYAMERGIFRIICEEAKADSENKYVLIIDEINRGNISKIFGELITLIEKDKRGKHKLQLSYSKDSFTVPENIYIIGTMNTADRSLIQIDTALRRRFAFCELMPNSELLHQVIEEISLKALLEEINKRIIESGLREKQIGHSYFMGIENVDDLQFTFANEIIPLLQDYFFDDYQKLEDILSSDFIDSKKMIIKDDWKQDSQVFLRILKNTFEI